MRGGETDADADVAEGEALLNPSRDRRPLDEVAAEEACREPVHREYQQRQRHEDAAQCEHLREAGGVVPVIAATRWGTMPSVQPNAVTSDSVLPPRIPAAIVRIAPVPGVAMMISDVTGNAQLMRPHPARRFLGNPGCSSSRLGLVDNGTGQLPYALDGVGLVR